MPAHRTHPEVPEQLMSVLAELRRDGLDFNNAWKRAVWGSYRCRALVRFPHPTHERRWWRQALTRQKAEWRAAYERRETGTSRSVAFLLEAIAQGLGDGTRDAPELDGIRVRLAAAPAPVPITVNERRHLEAERRKTSLRAAA